MVINLGRDIYDLDLIATDEKICILFTMWIRCHTFQRMPQLTNRRKDILSQYIQWKGYKECRLLLAFLSSDDPYCVWLRKNGYTLFDNIFNPEKWNDKIERATDYYKNKKDNK